MIKIVTKEKGEELFKRLLPSYNLQWETWEKGIPARVQHMDVFIAGSIVPLLSESEFVALIGHEAAHVKAMHDEHFAELKTREERNFEVGHDGTLFNLHLIGIYNRYKITENVQRSLHKKVEEWRRAGN